MNTTPASRRTDSTGVALRKQVALHQGTHVLAPNPATNPNPHARTHTLKGHRPRGRTKVPAQVCFTHTSQEFTTIFKKLGPRLTHVHIDAACVCVCASGWVRGVAFWTLGWCGLFGFRFICGPRKDGGLTQGQGHPLPHRCGLFPTSALSCRQKDMFFFVCVCVKSSACSPTDVIVMMGE